jgi:hypothetical protein
VAESIGKFSRHFFEKKISAKFFPTISSAMVEGRIMPDEYDKIVMSCNEDQLYEACMKL